MTATLIHQLAQGAGLSIVALIIILTVAFLTIISTENKNKP